MVRSFSILPLLLAPFSQGAILPRSPQGHEHGTAPAPKGAKGPFGKLSELLKGTSPKDVIPKLNSAIPKAKVFSTQSLPRKYGANSKRIYVRFGPYELAGKDQPKPESLTESLDPSGQAFAELVTSGLCFNCTILTGKIKMSFEDGSDAGPLQNIYLHHVVTRDFTKKPNLPITECWDGQTRPRGGGLGLDKLASEFLAAGEDSLGGGSVVFASQKNVESGYFVGSDLTLLNQIDLVNYNKDAKKVFLGYEIEYMDGHIGSDAAAILMSVTGCNGGETGGIKLSKDGVAVTESGNFSISKDSKIVAYFGHMHDGGSQMTLSLNGKEVCKSDAVYGKGGANNYETLQYMTPCPENISLKKGDLLKLKAEYDLAKHPLREGGEHNSMGMADVMGMFYMTFATA